MLNEFYLNATRWYEGLPFKYLAGDILTMRSSSSFRCRRISHCRPSHATVAASRQSAVDIVAHPDDVALFRLVLSSAAVLSPLALFSSTFLYLAVYYAQRDTYG